MSTKQKTKTQKVEKVEKVAKNVEINSNLLHTFWRKYSTETPVQIKLIDAFVLFLSSLIVWQVFYRYVLGTDFPKNAYLSGIFAPLGVIVITIALRLQIDNQNNRSIVQRAFWEFLAALLVLFVVIVNFLG